MRDYRDRWVWLEFTFAPGWTKVVYRDGLGRRAPFRSREQAALPPAQLLALVAEVARPLPEQRYGPHVSGPMPMAVYVSGPSRMTDDAERWAESWMEPLLGRPRFRLVRFAGDPRVRRSPFRLPFNILARAGSEWEPEIQAFEQQPWMEYEGMSERGVVVRRYGGDALEALRRHECDILFDPGLDAEALGELPLEDRPRLLVNARPSRGVPAGVSRLHAPTMHAQGGVLLNLLMGLIHDQPLHEAVHGAEQRPLELYTNPRANHDLRISDACIEMRRDAARLETRFGVSQRAPWREPLTLGGGAGGGHAANPLEHLRTLTNELHNVVRTTVDFGSESSGLYPLVLARAGLKRAVDAGRVLASVGRWFRPQPRAGEPEPPDERKVDVALERLDSYPLLEPVQSSTLAAGARYQVRVHIGNPLPGSIMFGEVEAVAPLLPDPDAPEGHDLEVVLQPKDFRLLSERVQRIHLPRSGGSDPAFFVIAAPREAMRAALRICIFRRNHLVQAFGLEAEVREEEERFEQKDQPSPAVRQEFARTRSFANLDALGGRALSVVANRVTSTGSHQLLVKGESVATINLEGKAFEEAMRTFRAALLEATEDANGRRRIYPPVAPGDVPSAEYAEVIRKLAVKGREIYSPLARRGLASAGADKGKFRTALVGVRDGEGQKIQVVRLAEDAAFPWTLVYDYLAQDLEQAPVCMGWARDAAGTVTPCGHTPLDEVCCIRGFWGVRHQVEEALDGAAECCHAVAPAKGAPLVLLTCGDAIPDPPSWCAELKQALGGAEVGEGPKTAPALLDLLWSDPPQRPAVLVLAGHMEEGAPRYAGEPHKPRIVFDTRTSWLTADDISLRFSRANLTEWEQPCRPLVLLMSCGSAAVDASELTGFFVELSAAGASAVIGTECAVYSDFVREFATFLSSRLCKAQPQGRPATLGEAMTAFRLQQLQAGNPLSFVLRSIGNVDLSVQLT